MLYINVPGEVSVIALRLNQRLASLASYCFPH